VDWCYVNNKCGRDGASTPVSQRSIPTRNEKGYPPGCGFYKHFGSSWMEYNYWVYTGEDGKVPDGEPMEFGYASATSPERVCCGSLTWLATSTTTTLPWIPLPILPQTRPPLQPIAYSTVPVTVERPAGAKIGACGLWGDPHLRTFDNDRLDCYSEGNFWIVNSDTVWIQGRYEPRDGPRRREVTYLQKVAVGGPFLMGNTLMIETHTLWWNSVSYNILGSCDGNGDNCVKHDLEFSAMDGKVMVKCSEGKTALICKVTLPNDVQIKMVSYRISRRAVSCSLVVVMRQITGQDGQCGAFKGIDGLPNTLIIGVEVEASKLLIPW